MSADSLQGVSAFARTKFPCVSQKFKKTIRSVGVYTFSPSDYVQPRGDALRRFLGMVFGLLSCASAAEAACTGSGLAWNCTAGSTVTQVQSVVSSAADKATITFDAGAYTWTSGSINLGNRNGVTLACATVRGCAVSFGGAGVFTLDSIPTPLTELIRISGFVFTGAPGSAAIWLFGASNLEKLRVDNNTFSGFPTDSIAILLGEVTAAGSIRGVIDHNIFTGPTNFIGVKSISGDTWLTGLQGTAQNLFIEDNTFNFSDNVNLGTGAIEA